MRKYQLHLVDSYSIVTSRNSHLQRVPKNQIALKSVRECASVKALKLASIMLLTTLILATMIYPISAISESVKSNNLVVVKGLPIEERSDLLENNDREID